MDQIDSYDHAAFNSLAKRHITTEAVRSVAIGYWGKEFRQNTRAALGAAIAGVPGLVAGLAADGWSMSGATVHLDLLVVGSRSLFLFDYGTVPFDDQRLTIPDKIISLILEGRIRPVIVSFQPSDAIVEDDEIAITPVHSCATRLVGATGGNDLYIRLKILSRSPFSGMPTPREINNEIFSILTHIPPREFIDLVIDDKWASKADELRKACGDSEYMDSFFDYLELLSMRKQNERVNQFFQAARNCDYDIKRALIAFLSSHPRIPVLGYIFGSIFSDRSHRMLVCSVEADRNTARFDHRNAVLISSRITVFEQQTYRKDIFCQEKNT